MDRVLLGGWRRRSTASPDELAYSLRRSWFYVGVAWSVMGFGIFFFGVSFAALDDPQTPIGVPILMWVGMAVIVGVGLAGAGVSRDVRFRRPTKEVVKTAGFFRWRKECRWTWDGQTRITIRRVPRYGAYGLALRRAEVDGTDLFPFPDLDQAREVARELAAFTGLPVVEEL